MEKGSFGLRPLLASLGINATFTQGFDPQANGRVTKEASCSKQAEPLTDNLHYETYPSRSLNLKSEPQTSTGF